MGNETHDSMVTFCVVFKKFRQVLDNEIFPGINTGKMQGDRKILVGLGGFPTAPCINKNNEKLQGGS